VSRFSSASFRPIELLINRGIRLSSTAQAMTRALEGKSLDVRLQDTPLALRLAARDGKIEVSTPGELPATALLAGTPLAMIRLLAGDPQALIREGEVRISGDTDVPTWRKNSQSSWATPWRTSWATWHGK
jgi:ubiquinone biosynthesis protein UbiJ